MSKYCYALLWMGLCVSGGLVLFKQGFPILPDEDRPLCFYCNQAGDELRDLFLLAMSEAKKSISLAVYGLSDPLLIRQLNARAQAGVHVQVYVDDAASGGVSRQLQAPLHLLRRRALGLMHLKILVIDETRVWVGTSNWTSQSLRGHGNFVFGLENTALAKEIAKRAFADTVEPGLLKGQVGDQEVEAYFLPDKGAALQRMVELLDSAKSTLRISMFTWTHPVLTAAVLRARQRGVEVQVVMDRQSTRGSSRATYTELLHQGVPLRRQMGSALHHYKLAWIDEDVLLVGSLNWTRSAFEKNYDCFFIISNLSMDQQQFLSRMWRTIWVEAKEA